MNSQRMIQSYKELQVWQMAIDLTDEVFDLIAHFPTNERFELRSQMNRAVISVPSNIAEGWWRRSTKEYIHHLAIAYGSLMELETQMTIAVRRNYLSEEQMKKFWEGSARTGQMLNRLIQALERKLPGSRSPDPGSR